MKSAEGKWQKIFQDCKDSGLAPSDYCELNGINYGTFKVARCKYNTKRTAEVKRSPTEWDFLIGEYLSNGMTAIDFCSSKDIKYNTFTKKLKEYSTDTKRGLNPAERWERLNTEWENSGQLQTEFCASVGVNYHTFKYMRHCLKNKKEVYTILDQYGIVDKETAIDEIVRMFHSRRGNVVRHRYTAASVHVLAWLKERGYM